jgi:hypothetical protein
MELPASLFIIPIGAIVAMVFIDSLRFSPQVPTVGTVIGAAFGCLIVLGGLALLVKAIHAMVAKGQNCAARTAFAGVVKGRSEVQFLFANPEFAKEFARLNPGVKVQCRRLSII